MHDCECQGVRVVPIVIVPRLVQPLCACVWFRLRDYNYSSTTTTPAQWPFQMLWCPTNASRYATTASRRLAPTVHRRKVCLIARLWTPPAGAGQTGHTSRDLSESLCEVHAIQYGIYFLRSPQEPSAATHRPFRKSIRVAQDDNEARKGLVPCSLASAGITKRSA
jgi:hypothetical protein